MSSKPKICKIVVQSSPTADTRTCDVSTVTPEKLLRSSMLHIDDVQKALEYMAELVRERFCIHDFDKIGDIAGFHRDFVNTSEPFISGEWYKNHIKLNRHHLTAEGGVPDDVNLYDVLEMIADCAVAGMARSGSVYPIDIPSETLQRAVKNTLDKLIDVIKVEPASDQDDE